MNVMPAQINAQTKGTPHPGSVSIILQRADVTYLFRMKTGSGTALITTTTVQAPAISNPGIAQNHERSLIIFLNIGLALYLAASPSRKGRPPPALTATTSSTI